MEVIIMIYKNNIFNDKKLIEIASQTRKDLDIMINSINDRGIIESEDMMFDFIFMHKEKIENLRLIINPKIKGMWTVADKDQEKL